MVKNSISVTRDMRTDLNLQLRHEKAEHLRGGTRKIYHTGKKTKIKIQFWFKGQLKRWDKLTSIARFWSPENGFEGIFEKFVFVLEISAVKVEELCGTNSRFSSFSEKNIVGRFLSVTSLMISTLSVKLMFIQNQGVCFLGAGLSGRRFWRFLRNIS